MKRWISGPAAALLIGVGGLARPVWGHASVEMIVAQGMAHVDAGLDAEKVKQLVADAEELLEAGKYAKAMAIITRTLAWQETHLGPEHPDTASGLNNLAQLYERQGFYAKAEPLYQRALSISEKALGHEHQDTARSLNNLAYLYYLQGHYAKAEPLYQRALAIHIKVLGPEHPHTALSLNNLALLFYNQGLYEKAKPLYQRALAIHEKALGAEHPNTALSLNNLAQLYERQGLYAKADPLYQRALAICNKVFGPEHPNTSLTLYNLAYLYYRQGLYVKAEPLYQRALAINEKALGPEHPNTALSLNSLAQLYDSQSLYAKAAPLYQRALAISEKALGPEHPNTALSLNNLASLYERQGLYSKAEPLYQRALAISEKAIGVESPNTAISLNNLAHLYYLQGFHAKAEPLYQRALAIHEKVLGPLHIDTAISLNNLAQLYDKQGFYAKAESLYLRALAISEKAFRPEHPLIALSLHNLASLYYGQGLYAKGQPLYLRSLAMSEKVFGREHPNTAVNLINLAQLYDSQGQYSHSQPLIKRALGIEFTLIQREAPYLPVAERQSYLSTFDNADELAFSSAQRGSSGTQLALFSRLNRQGLLQEIEQRQAQLASLPGAQQALVTNLRQITRQLASLALTAEQRQQLISRQEELERQLYRLLPQLKPRVVEVQQMAAALPAGSALIEFQLYRPYDSTAAVEKRRGEARYLAMVLKPSGAITPIDLGLAKPIDVSIRLALKATERFHPDALELWARVGRSVLDPLAIATKGSAALFISPDGELNRIPFAALPAPGSRQLLADVMKFRLLTTGRELLDLQNTSKIKSAQALILANPAFHRSSVPVRTHLSILSTQQRSADLGSQQWNQLPGTAKEGAAIALLTGGRLLTEDQARVTAIQQQKEAPWVLHLATHAYYQPDLAAPARQGDQQLTATRQQVAAQTADNPLLRSGIVLAGANQPEADPRDDGYLTALEVARLNWKGTEMVVISACQSGKGDITAGEGVYGLKRAIAVAGARSSLLSLWSVDDTATAAFMESFYNKLKAGIGRGDALVATQKEFREHKIVSWRHPYVWAAFQLSGDWRRLRSRCGKCQER